MFLPLVAVGRLDFGSGDVADIVLEMFIILSQLTWGDMDLPPMEKGAGGTPGPTREWGAETTEGDTTNEVVRGGWDDGKGGGREQGSDGGPVINELIHRELKLEGAIGHFAKPLWRLKTGHFTT